MCVQSVVILLPSIKTMPAALCHYMCVFKPFFPFSHPEEGLFTWSLCANGNGYNGNGGISQCGLLATDNDGMPVGCNCIFITLKVFPFFPREL